MQKANQFVALVLFFLMSFAGQASGQSQGVTAKPGTIQELIEGARKEGSLTLSFGAGLLGTSKDIQRLQDLFNSKYGLKVAFKYTPGPSGPAMGARIMQEIAAGRPASTDVYPVSMTSTNKQAFQIVDWERYVPGLPEDTLYYEKRGVSYATLVLGMTYNTKLIPPTRVPQSYGELLKPEWKGKIALRVSTTFLGYLAEPEYLGQKGAMDLMRQLARQSSGMIRCAEMERILSGEFPVFAFDCGDYGARVRQRMGQPLGHIIPSDGGGLGIWPVGVPVNAASPNAAKLLVAFLLSREGQDYMWEVTGTDYHGVAGSKIAEIIKKYEARGVKFMNVLRLEEERPHYIKNQEEMLRVLQEAMAR